MFAVAADVFGRRWVAVTAAATVSLFAVLLAVSTSSIWLVITWRGLMGVSGAGIYLFTPLVIAEIVSVAQRGTWLGVASVVSGTFGMIAPVLCGYYADGPGWRWVFYTIAILCAVVALCYVFLFTETLPPEDARALLDSDADVSAEGPPTKTPSRLAAMLSTIDWGGSFLWFAGSFSLLIGLNIGGGGLKTFNNPAVIALLCAGGVLLACFLLYEGKFAKHPLIPLSFFSTRNFNSISAFSFLSGAIGAGYPFIFPTWAQAVFGVNGTTTGTWTLPGSILIMAVSLGTGFLVQKSGRTRELIWVACLFACFATILPIFATASTSWMALVSQVAYGTAFGAFKVVPAVVAQLSVPPESIAQATAVRSSLYFAGGSAGITVLSLIPVVVARGVLDAQLPELLASFGWPVEVQAALLATYYASGFPAMMSQLTTGYPDLAQPGPVSGLDAANYAARRQGFSAAWIAAAGIMGAASLCSLLLRHIPLAGDRREAVARRCCSLAANLEPSCSFSHTAA
ncbi:major facilitator superfamily domain-containing protein [Hyaloraphidium curvatum]|nr:major facilitator superfamily domain-containing protein [Hyaloraphidium curvatum]